MTDMTNIFVVEYLGPTGWTNAYEGKSLSPATDTANWYRKNGFNVRVRHSVVDKYGQSVQFEFNN